VKLNQLKGVEVQAVADALEIHPSCCRDGGKKRATVAVRASVRVESGQESTAGQTDAAFSGAPARPRAARRGACPLKKTYPVHLRTKADVFAFIEQERQAFGVTRRCRLLGVTRPGFYA
jgi:hypothetical protein